MKLLTILSLTLLPLLFRAPGCRAQVQLTNVRLQPVGTTSLEIRYDAAGLVPADSVWFEVKSRLNRPLTPDRKYITGDAGLDVAEGTNRRILWNVVANGYQLDEEIRVTVLVRLAPRGREEPKRPAEPVQPPAPPTTAKVRRPGGPAFALLSAVAPGIGNIFVQTPRPRVGLRPLITAASYGLVAYGLAQRRISRNAYADYREQKNATAAEPYYERANGAHQRYYVATRLAGVIWATDVAATLLRGVRNRQPGRALTLRPGAQAGQPVAVIHYRF